MKKTKVQGEMNVTLKTIIEDSANLEKLCGMKFPIKISYWLQRILAAVKSEITTYNKTREELIKQLGELNDEGEHAVKPDKLKEFYTELGKLQEVSLNLGFKQIDITELGNIEVEPVLLLPWVFSGEL